MKILITSDWNDLAVNGVATSVKNLRRELEALGHEVRILTLSQSHRSMEKDGITYLGSIPVGRIYPGARLRTAMSGKWMRQIMAWRPEIIHSQCEFSTFSLALRIAEELDIPVVHTYHTVYEDYTHYFSPSVRLGKKAVAALSRRVSERTDVMIAPTDKVRRLLLRYGVRVPIHVVPSGIDLRRFEKKTEPRTLQQMRAELCIPEENTVLVSLGRLAEEKNIEELLHFRARMGDAAVTLLIVGGGPWRGNLEDTAEKLGLRPPQVVFAGMVPPDTVQDWYRMGDLFVSASTSETQGLTYIEALAAGVPLLCRADECLEDVIRQGENGWQYRTEEEFGAALQEFLAAPQRCGTMREAALESAAKYSSALFAKRMEAIYKEELARRERSKNTRLSA